MLENTIEQGQTINETESEYLMLLKLKIKVKKTFLSDSDEYNQSTLYIVDKLHKGPK